jgi:carbonic anhydrase
VHRNIANVISSKDLSAASVIEFSVAFVGVEHIVVCGHTKCGGANAALGDDDLGEVLNNWLAPVRELRKKHANELETLSSNDEKATKLAELNVKMSIDEVKKHPAVIDATQKRDLKVHGVIYDIAEGELKVIDA